MKIKKVSVVDQVSEALKEKLLNHTWEPGDKLPSEGELADTFGVNRLSVRCLLYTSWPSAMVLWNPWGIM